VNARVVFVFAVDRIEGDTAVLVRDDGVTRKVPTALLPRGTREGSVLRVRAGTAGGPAWWGKAALDQGERQRRLAEGLRRLDRVEQRNRGP